MASVMLSALAVGVAGCYSGIHGFDRDPGQDGGASSDGDGGESEGETEGEPDAPDPGRVTMHRLTNAEYDNTIRDLFFGLPVQPSADFPADEVSLGFDNISEVLSVTPVLFELYERAAEQTIEQALTTTGGSGEVQHHEAEDTGSSVGSACCGGFWNLNSNGEIATPVTIDGGGEHEIVVRAYGQQAGPDLPHMVVTVDGAVVAEIDVSATSEAPAEHTIAIDLSSGNHTITVAFTNDFFDVDAGDRNLYVDWVEVGSIAQGPNSVRDQVILCEPAPGNEAECVEQILRTFGKRAWRRPLTDEEVTGLVNVVDSALGEGQDFDASISLGLKAVLISPYFLFRVEIDPDPGSLTPHPLNDYELASRLSYFVWSTMPDDDLMAMADAGTLADPANLEQQVRRMLADERASALVDNFAGQWLYLRNLGWLVKDYEAFPDFDEELQASMKTESEMFFGTFITEGRSLRELLTAQETFVDARLAEHYGLPAPEGEGFSRVSLEGLPRRGLLTQPGIMSVLSHAVTTSPVKRGKWVLEQLMCIVPPPPPPGVEEPPLEPEIGGTMREQLEIHRANPDCAGCHNLMDPIGLSLEHYDAVGRYRDLDAGMPIDASGSLPGGGESFDDALGLVDALADSEDFSYCTTYKTLTYALGREPEESDEPYLDEIVAEFEAADMTLESLLVAIVTNDTFRMRRGEQ